MINIGDTVRISAEWSHFHLMTGKVVKIFPMKSEAEYVYALKFDKIDGELSFNENEVYKEIINED